MSNRFFNFISGRLIPGTVAKSKDVNAIIDSVVTGMDLVQGELNRALKLPAGDASAEHNFSSDAATRASKLVQFDGSGNPVASNTLGADLDANAKKITNLPSPALSGEPVTLGYLNAFAGSLAGLPSLLGQSGKYLSNDGTTVYWAAFTGIPSQDVSSTGKVLMSDGTTASWQTSPNQVPASTDAGVELSHDNATFGFRNNAQNLVFNPCGSVNYGGTAMGWTSTTVVMAPTLGARGWSFDTGALAAQTGQHECDSFAFSGSTDIAVSADIDTTAMTAGALALVVDFRDGADASISTSSTAISSGVLKRYKVTATSPASCAKVRVRLLFTGYSCSSATRMTRVKAERGTVPTPFNDAATIAWSAGFRATTEFGRGYTSPIVRIGDATSTGAKTQWRSTSGAQTYDAELSVVGGTSGTSGRADVTLTCKSFRTNGILGFTQEYDAGDSGTDIVLHFDTNGSRQRFRLTGNCNVTPVIGAGMPVGTYRVKITQDGTGGRTMNWGGFAVLWAGGDTPDALPAGSVIFVDLYFDGSSIWGSWVQWL